MNFVPVSLAPVRFAEADLTCDAFLDGRIRLAEGGRQSEGEGSRDHLRDRGIDDVRREVGGPDDPFGFSAHVPELPGRPLGGDRVQHPTGG